MYRSKAIIPQTSESIKNIVNTAIIIDSLLNSSLLNAHNIMNPAMPEQRTMM